MEHRPFKLLNRTECGEVAARLAPTLHAWAQDWFGASADLSAKVDDFGSADVNFPSSLEVSCDERADRWVLSRAGSEVRRIVVRMLSDGSEPGRLPLSPVLEAVVCRCLVDLRERILHGRALAAGEAMRPPAAAVPKAPERGSGAARVLVRLAPLELSLLLSPALTRSLLSTPKVASRKARLIRRRDGLGRQTVRARVFAGQAQLSVSDVYSLRVGDVIRLDRTHGNGFEVQFAEGCAPVMAQLGSRYGHRAVVFRSNDEQ